MYIEIFYVTGILLSVIPNLLVIIVLLNKRHKLNHLDLCIVSLAVSDCLQAGIGYSLEIYSFDFSSDSERFPSCKIAGFSITLLALVSICHLVGLSIERFAIHRFPIKARLWYTNRKIALYIIVPSWLYSLGCSLPPLFGWSSYRNLKQGSLFCQVDLTSGDERAASYLWFLLVLCFICPTLIIIVFSVLICKESRKVRQDVAALGMSQPHIERRRLEERRHAIMTFICTFVYIISWSPYAACCFVYALNGKVSETHIISSAVFAKLSTIYNPFIYTIFNKSFRRGCLKLFGITSIGRSTTFQDGDGNNDSTKTIKSFKSTLRRHEGFYNVAIELDTFGEHPTGTVSEISIRCPTDNDKSPDLYSTNAFG